MAVRGSAVAGLALALLAARAEAREVAPRPAVGAPSTEQALSAGGLVGFEFASGTTGFGLRLDGELPVQALGPRMNLSALGSLGFTRFSDSTSTGVGDYSQATNIFKLVPAARFTLPLAPAVAVYGDAGLGLYWARSTIDTPFGSSSDSAVGVTMRLAAGALYHVNDKLRVGVELGWNPYFGDFSEDTISVLAALMVRL
ncbi:outer membrane beta-barrel protein [Anaeromyxobacter sp. SG64]|uniref:outer membrane beta-barrel protein n=1 Tax=Anaeromyxobacter sp. SG64 TaxID=2925409 RepID=UPI001F5AE206|nr:outer membrane beta-barrel protein [Anaeromyxobacter sp. SG64]